MDGTITIGGRELTLVFDTAAWVELEATFGSLDRMYKRLAEDVLPMTTGLQLAAITATSGSCDRKKKESITFDWLVANASPKQARELGRMARNAVADGLETTESLFDEDAPSDAVLEEENAKKIRADA